MFKWELREKTISHREVRKVSLRSVTWIKFEWSEGAKLYENIMEFVDRTSSTKTLIWLQVGWILEAVREEWDGKWLRDETRVIIWSKIMQKFFGHGKDFEIYSKYVKSQLEDFEQRNNMISFVFKEDIWGCSVDQK